MLVLAGPGSGKTTVMIHRVIHLTEKLNIPPSDILVITFTKAAAEEMKERYIKMTSSGHRISFGTFHSLFFRIIRSVFGYNVDDIIKEDEKRNVLKNAIRDLDPDTPDEDEFLHNITNEISLLKNELINIDGYFSKTCSDSDFRKIYSLYDNYKEMNHKIDFDDMLELCYYTLKECEDVRLSWQKRYKYILIDEFQDINKAQYECVKLLSGEEKNVFAVGDDDQSIYGFRGARPEFLLKFPADFENSQKIVLDTNYRSSDSIIKISNAIISHNKKRYEKTIHGTDKQGPLPKLIRPDDINSEAKEIARRIKKLSERIPLNNIAVIYRTNIQARAIVDTFMDYHINYRLRDEIPSIYRHWCARDILAYLSLSLNRYDNDSIERIINKPKRYISKITIAESKKSCRQNESLIESLFRRKDLKSYQFDRLHDLTFQISRIKEKNTYDAIKYIMKVIGYEDYLKEYSVYRKLDYKSLLETVSEISEAAKDYPDINNFLDHIKNVTEELKEKQSTSKIHNADGVILTTMHSAKGLEFDTVFITSVVDGIIPHERSVTEDEKEEERRLFYVAVTRAKRLLYLSAVKTRYDKETKISPFLKDFTK